MNPIAVKQNVAEKDLWVGWESYHQSIEDLICQVASSGWSFDSLICLARGGLRVGDIFSRVFNIPLAILSVSSYREEVGHTQGVLDIGSHITIARGRVEGRVLIVDDLVDSGVTLAAVSAHLKQQNSLVTEVKTAVIWRKALSPYTPDFYVEYLPHNPWIHQPFEEYDTLTPAQLLARRKLKIKD